MRSTVIIGLGVTGLSCVRFLHGKNRLRVIDTRSQPPMLDRLRAEFPDVEIETAARKPSFVNVDRVVVSPGLGLDSCVLQGIDQETPLISDIDLFCEAAGAPIIAITGTNGKSTVTSMVGHVLNRCGRRAPVGGNLGEPALDLLSDDAQAYVLELSSFQLERLQPHHFHAATILNVSEDHLDRHGDMSAYVESKQRIYRDCSLAVAWRDDERTLPGGHVDRLITFGQDEPRSEALDVEWGIREKNNQRWLANGPRDVVDAAELRIGGRHNELNALAACALLTGSGIEASALAECMVSFKGLPHRCERVGQAAGVSYIDDSKATNVGAAIAALTGFGDARSRHIVLIAGGDGKGADFGPLRESVEKYVKTVVVFGRDAREIAQTLAGACPVIEVADMAEAVASASAQARPGDVVLLSPACASLDMYPGFAARGEDFAARVGDLLS